MLGVVRDARRVAVAPDGVDLVDIAQAPVDQGLARNLGRADDEVDEGLVGAAAIDRERRDPGADDDGEREEALADDLNTPSAIAELSALATAANVAKVYSGAEWAGEFETLVAAASAPGS